MSDPPKGGIFVTKEKPSVRSGPPAHHRKRLGYTLRDARQRLDMTEAEAAEKIGRAQSWINRIERAQMVRIKMADLNKLLDVLGITDQRAEELRGFARTPYSQTGAWIEQPALVHPGPTGPEDEIEKEARAIKSLHVEVHDGLIQSEAYMRRQFEVGSQANVERKVQERLARQRAIFDQPGPPQCSFVLTEAALHTDMGDPAMMAKQIAHLLALSQRPYITILIKPFGARFPTSTYDFTVLQFNSGAMQDFVYLNRIDGTAVIDDEDAVRRYHTRWDTACGASLSEYDSRQKLREMLDAYNTTRTEGH